MRQHITSITVNINNILILTVVNLTYFVKLHQDYRFSHVLNGRMITLITFIHTYFLERPGKFVTRTYGTL